MENTKVFYNPNTKSMALNKNDWTFILQLNGESDLMDSMLNTFNTVVKNFKKESRIEYFVILDGSPDNTLSSNPKLYHINESTKLGAPCETFDFNDLTKSNNLVNIFNKIQDIRSNKNSEIIYIIRDHGAGMYLSTDNSYYKQLEIQFQSSSTKEIEDEIRKQFSDKFQSYDLVDVISLDDRNNYRLLYKRSKANARNLKIPHLTSAIQNSEFKKINLVCLDCCWGQMLENNYHIHPVTDYFIANEDQGPIAGLGYDKLTSYLNNISHPLRPEEMVNAICANFILSNQHDYLTKKEFFSYGVCLTAVRSSGMEKIKALFEDFTIYLINEMKSDAEKFTILISQVRRKCFDFLYEGRIPSSRGEYGCYVIDLIRFLNELREKIKDKTDYLDLFHTCCELQIEILSSIKVEKSNYNSSRLNPGPEGNGISIFFPMTMNHWKNSDMYVQPSVIGTLAGQRSQTPFEYYSGWPVFLNIYLQNILKENDRVKLNDKLTDNLNSTFPIKHADQNQAENFIKFLSEENEAFVNQINDNDKNYLNAINQLSNQYIFEIDNKVHTPFSPNSEHGI